MVKPELTEADKAKPYAEYYFRSPARIPEKVLQQLRKSSHRPEDALPAEKINDLLLPGNLPMENGHCRLPDGSLAMAMHCAQEYSNLAQILPQIYQEFGSSKKAKGGA